MGSHGEETTFPTSMRYNPASPLVLDGVTLTVPAGTTLGVVIELVPENQVSS
jgi:hypothetical protein